MRVWKREGLPRLPVDARGDPVKAAELRARVALCVLNPPPLTNVTLDKSLPEFPSL